MSEDLCILTVYRYENCAKKTLIMVSYRLSCVKDMDRIIVLDKGKIIEIGSHMELINLGGNMPRCLNYKEKDMALTNAEFGHTKKSVQYCYEVL